MVLCNLQFCSHNLEFKIISSNKACLVRKTVQCHFRDKGGLEVLKISYLACTRTTQSFILLA